MRLNQIARQLGVSTEKIISFLKKEDSSVDYKPNTKLTKSALSLLKKLVPESQQLQNEKPAPQQEAPKTVQEETSADQVKTDSAKSAPLTSKTPASTEAFPKKIAPYAPSLTKITTLGKIKLPTKKGTPRKRIQRDPSLNSRLSSARPPFKPGGTPFKKPYVRPSSRLSRGGSRKKRKKEKKPLESTRPEVIKIIPFSTLEEVALLFDVPITTLINIYADLDIKVSPNQRLEAKLITLVAEELEKDIEIVNFKKQVPQEENETGKVDLSPKVPVVVVMGHVDHGKTSLLDHIRKSKVIENEAGHITQHVGAYQVQTDAGKITFLDTPGHQAFTAMRARGAKVTDIAIVVIAADDGMMPQTKEAIHHAQHAGIPIVFAFNKIDLPTANVERVMQQLSELKITVEDWGGNYQCQAISTKTGEGIEELLEKVLLEAEMMKLTTNEKGEAQGTVIESTIKKGQGFLITAIVQQGMLKTRDTVVAGGLYGRIKAMFTTEGKPIKEAPPAMPVQLLGINGAPSSGQTFQVVATEQEARKLSKQYQEAALEQKLRAKEGDRVKKFEKLMFEGAPAKTLNIVLKGDTDGSIGALADSITALSTPDTEINVIYKAVGNITESDIMIANNSDAIIMGFQIKTDKKAAMMIAREGINAKTFHIIYEALDYIKELITAQEEPTQKEISLGKADVVRVFNISRIGKVAGCVVRKGVIKRNAMMRIMRNEEEVYTGKITQLKREKEVIKEAKKDSECGISTGEFEVKEGDTIVCFEIKEETGQEQ